MNVRAGANANFEILAKLKQSDEIVVLGQNFAWYKIQLPAGIGVFIRADYVKELPGHIGEIIGSKVNVRAKADSNSSVLGQLSKGDYVHLVKQFGDWWITEPPAHSFAWIHADLVTLKSAQVPSDMLTKELRGKDLPEPKPLGPEAPVVVSVSIQGKIKSLSDVVVGMDNIHYQVLVDDKPVYYLQDASGLDHFNNAVVHIDGIVTPGNKSVLSIKRIFLVL